jgi:hypothetical protein
MTECDNFKSDAGGGDLEAEKLLRGDFFEEFGLDTKPCSRVGHFSVCRDQLRGAQFQGSGNMNAVKCSQKKNGGSAWMGRSNIFSVNSVRLTEGYQRFFVDLG